jgi:hypothetical protein
MGQAADQLTDIDGNPDVRRAPISLKKSALLRL